MSQDLNTMPSEFFMTCRFEDSEAFAEACRGWDLDFRQLETGGFVSRLGFLATPGVLLTECSLSRRMEQNGSPPEGYVTFGFPMNDVMQLRWRGALHSGEGFMLFRQGEALDAVSDARFHVVTAAISESLLMEAAERREFDLSSILSGRQDVFSCASELRGQIRALLGQLMSAPERELSILSERPFREGLEGDLVELILDALEGGGVASARTMARERSRVLRSALNLIREFSDEPISIQSIEEVTSASSRTLRNAFQEAFGVSPKQYLQTYRLNGVQRKLRELKGVDNAVSLAANEWGYWHMGQFAADYRKLFGELPSETLTK